MVREDDLAVESRGACPPGPAGACAPAETPAAGQMREAGGRVLIVGGSPERPSPGFLRSLALGAAAVVACDSGLEPCLAAGVVPDVVVGDFDSADPDALAAIAGRGVEFETFPAEKDDTDLGLAVERARRFAGGVRRVVFCAVSGGRLDHTLGAIGCIMRAIDLDPVVEEESFYMVPLASGRRCVWHARPGDVGRTLSVLSLVDGTRVSERGTHWDVEDLRMGLLCDRGVSNVVERPDASVELLEGAALVIVQRR